MSLIFVVTGPSGAGKTTVAQYIEEKYKFRRPRTMTTREPREGESVDSYIFVSKSEFEKYIAKHEMLEYVQYSDNLYGCHISAFEEGGNMIMALEKDGCDCFKQLFADRCVTVLLWVRESELCQRIKDRSDGDDLAYRKADLERYEEMNADYAIDATKPLPEVKAAMDRIISQHIPLTGSEKHLEQQ